MNLSVLRGHGLMETIRRLGLDDHEDGRIFLEDVREVSSHTRGHGSHARLQENVRRANALLLHFLNRLLGHRHVARHQALRNVGVARTVRILHVGPTVFSAVAFASSTVAS